MSAGERTAETAPGASRGDGRIRGLAVTSDGWPVPFAVVTVIDASGTQVGGTSVRGDGTFEVEGLPEGPCHRDHLGGRALPGGAPAVRRRATWAAWCSRARAR